ncbi:Peroxisomal membrane protein 4 [Phytophthora cinnamomi]|uniref:Peroxisomal membrane protein 4 n=1 Tax=Phytophthora cinnamomi TaxID=4785 RepID=UPI0035599460|nr:Peroxisomal membrane protein 4 [Phytophthora cinnamomi]
MKSRLVDLLPELTVSDGDRDMLRGLTSTLVLHNLEQCNMLLVTKNGYPDSTRGQWKELRRKNGLRIYRERPSSAPGAAPFTPSLLLLGTVDGTVEDVMYGVVAPTDAALKIKSRCVNDGMLDTKMLCELVETTVEDPFRHVGIKWKLYHGRDYVSLDATGVVHSSMGERFGYNLAHSVAFSELPDFKDYGVLRGNMSVCSLYKQKTPTTVECYVRGFFDFPTKNEMLNNVALQALASQWLSFGRKMNKGSKRTAITTHSRRRSPNVPLLISLLVTTRRLGNAFTGNSTI